MNRNKNTDMGKEDREETKGLKLSQTSLISQRRKDEGSTPPPVFKTNMGAAARTGRAPIKKAPAAPPFHLRQRHPDASCLRTGSPQAEAKPCQEPRRGRRRNPLPVPAVRQRLTVNGWPSTLPTEKQLSPGLTAPVSTWCRFIAEPSFPAPGRPATQPPEPTAEALRAARPLISLSGGGDGLTQCGAGLLRGASPPWADQELLSG